MGADLNGMLALSRRWVNTRRAGVIDQAAYTNPLVTHPYGLPVPCGNPL